MRRSTSAAALAAAVALTATAGCGADPLPAPPPPRADWSLTSSDGHFVVEQFREGARCRVSARVRPDRRLWTSRACVPTSATAFLSPDGRRMLVLDAFPGGADWSNLPLLSLWVDGVVLREYRGLDVLGPGAADTRGRLSWLRGASAEAVRAAAHAAPQGDAVALELADGRTLGVGFDGAPLPPPPRAARQAAADPVAVAAADPAASPPAVEERPEPVLPAAKPPPRPAPPRPVAVTPRRHRERAAPRVVAPPPPGPAPHEATAQDALAVDEVGLYRWEDETGALHFGSGSQIPPRLRRRAVPVNGTVGVVPLDRPTTTTTPTAPPAAAPAVPAREGAGAPAAAGGEGAAPPRAAPANEAPQKPVLR